MNPSPLKYDLSLPSRASDEELSIFINSLTGWLHGFSKYKIHASSPALRASLSEVADRIFADLLPNQRRVSPASLKQLMSSHVAFTNLLALSDHRSTQAYLPHFNRGKTFSPLGYFFVNARASWDADIDLFFERDPLSASEWYGQYFYGARSFIDPVVHENLAKHLRLWSPHMRLLPSVSNGYMRSTYIDPQADRIWKFRFNQLCKEHLTLKVHNTPNRRRIAVVTQRWAKVNPTYKNRFELFENLATKYDLDLIHVGAPRNDLETEIFKNVKNIGFSAKGGFNLKALLNNDYCCVFYPDIGMNIESRFISNIRFAPIQMTTNSHPVSTFGSNIDYFVSGSASEQPEGAFYYSEKLLLMSGIGTRSIVPARRPNNTDYGSREVLVACPWGCLKANHPLIRRLASIQAMAHRPVRYRFLFTVGNDGGHALLVKTDIERVLGHSNFDFFHDIEYPRYLELLGQCHFALDAFPFGGNTSVIDSLAQGVPIICQDGWQFYNKAGPAILANVGLAECSVKTAGEYIRLAIRLTQDATLYNQLKQKIIHLQDRDIMKSFSKPDELTFLINTLTKSLKIKN